jgi:hypothetical protein
MRLFFLMVLFLFASFSLADEKNHAIQISANVSNSNATYFPVSSFSFFWLKSKDCHVITADYFGNPNYKTGIGECFNQGVFYSYLLKLKFNHLYIGPSIGILASRTEYQSISTDMWGYKKTDYLFKDGLYFVGLNSFLIFGTNTVRLTIQDRILMGAAIINRLSTYGFNNTFGIGAMFAF